MNLNRSDVTRTPYGHLMAAADARNACIGIEVGDLIDSTYRPLTALTATTARGWLSERIVNGDLMDAANRLRQRL